MEVGKLLRAPANTQPFTFLPYRQLVCYLGAIASAGFLLNYLTHAIYFWDLVPTSWMV